MTVCYNKLWKLLIDRKMKKKDLVALSGVSKATIAKMGRDVNVSTEVLARICNALQVDVGDIMEMIPDMGKANSEQPTHNSSNSCKT